MNRWSRLLPLVIALGCGWGCGDGGAAADAAPETDAEPIADAGGDARGDGDAGRDAGLDPISYDQFGTDGVDGAYALAVGPGGGVLTGGGTAGDLDGTGNGVMDGFASARQPGADPDWTRQWGTSGTDEATGIFAEASGAVVATGTVGGLLGDAHMGGTDAVVIRWLPSGVVDWVTQWGSDTDEIVYGAARDASGNIVVVGTTLGDLDGESAGDYDAFASKVSPTGELVWARQWGSTRVDGAVAAAIDGSGNIFVVGETRGLIGSRLSGSGRSAFCTKLDSSGAIQWTVQWGSNQTDLGLGVSVTSTGALIVVGHASGTIDGSTGAGGGFISELDTDDGALVWTRQLGADADDELRAVVAGDNGEFFVAGVTGGEVVDGAHQGGDDVYVQKCDPTGQAIWTEQLGSAANERPRALARAGDGTLYMAGETNGAFPGQRNAGSFDAFVIAVRRQ